MGLLDRDEALRRLQEKDVWKVICADSVEKHKRGRSTYLVFKTNDEILFEIRAADLATQKRASDALFEEFGWVWRKGEAGEFQNTIEFLHAAAGPPIIQSLEEEQLEDIIRDWLGSAGINSAVLETSSPDEHTRAQNALRSGVDVVSLGGERLLIRLTPLMAFIRMNHHGLSQDDVIRMLLQLGFSADRNNRVKYWDGPWTT